MNREFTVTGAKVLFEIPVLGGIKITETVVNTWIVMAVIVGLCLFMTSGMQVRCKTRRQVVAEFIVKKVNAMVGENMGEHFLQVGYAPLIATIMGLSALCSLSGMGPVGYIKGYFQPIPVLLPFNIISEVATPLSMAFRHFGNIASGTVIMGLLRWALANLSFMIFSKLPGVLGQIFGQIPILQVGIPAVFSIYFDIFSSLLQAFIFCMLTMMYIGSAAEE